MTFATAIDQVMGYWGIKVSRRSQKYLTITTPWGKYYYKRLPMGLSISADVFQREMSKLLEGIEGALVYIDDLLLVTCGSYEHHLEQLKKILDKMKESQIQINMEKTIVGNDTVEYLGYVLTKKGVKPQQSKVTSIMNMAIPKTVKQLRGVIGLVNFYRDLWKGRAHHLAPLTKLLSKKKGRH